MPKLFQPKSLRSSVLRRCVVFFEKIFFEENSENSEKTVKKNVVLPPHVFENIVETNREMGGYISPTSLISCLGFIDSLNWQNIDLAYIGENNEIGKLVDDDIKKIAGASIKVRKLTFSTNAMRRKMMLYLSSFASTLEHLHIGPEGDPRYNRYYEQDYLENKEEFEELFKNKIKMPELKYLDLNFLNLSMEIIDMIDLNSFSGSIRALKLRNFSELNFVTNDLFYNEMKKIFFRIDNEELFLDYRYSYIYKIRLFLDVPNYSSMLINAMKSYKKLNTLSLINSKFLESNQLMDAFSSLQELEILDLTRFGDFHSKQTFDFSDLIVKIPSLRYIELYQIRAKMINTENIKNKRFKYFGAPGYDDDSFQVEADEISDKKDVDEMIACLQSADFKGDTSIKFAMHCAIIQEVRDHKFRQGVLDRIYRFPYDDSIHTNSSMRLLFNRYEMYCDDNELFDALTRHKMILMRDSTKRYYRW